MLIGPKSTSLALMSSIERLSGNLTNSMDKIAIVYLGPDSHYTTSATVMALQEHLRQYDACSMVLMYSFLNRPTLAKEYPIIAMNSAGIAFLRAPFDAIECCQKLNALKSMTSEELAYIRRWHCGLQQQWNIVAHSLGHMFSDWPANRQSALNLLRSIEPDIHKLAPDQETTLIALFTSLETDTATEFQKLCAELDKCMNEPDGEVPAAPYDRGPLGFDGIVVADDHGYDCSAMDKLIRKGYVIFDVARDLEAARKSLVKFRPDVVLADLHFPVSPDSEPSIQGGRLLIESSLNADCKPMVIAVSHATPEETLPEMVENCCGLTRFNDAELIHKLIWRRAQLHGVSIHV